jgi:uncharacterized repeat protein (TIGR01451 family)
MRRLRLFAKYERITLTKTLLCLAVFAFALSSAYAQTATTLFASGGITRPESGVILSGSAINPSTGQPYRHLWYGDAVNGVCRIDPDVDTPGRHFVNAGTCLHLIFGVQLQPGQLAFDPVFDDIYAVDQAATTQGIFRLHYLPGGDSGHGMIDPLRQEVLGGSGSTRLGGISGCGIPTNIPDSAIMGPDGNLYIGFKKSGQIIRVLAPQTEPLPCANVQVMGSTPDRLRDFGLGWIGHDLYGADSQSGWVIYNADKCRTAANKNVCTGVHFLVGILPLATHMISDQVYPALNGHALYYAAPGNVSKLQIQPSVLLTVNWAEPFNLATGLAVDPTNQVLYVGDDPTAETPGARASTLGHWYVTAPPSPAPATPGAPTSVSAIAGDAQASLSWTPAQDGQPVTSYIVHTLASGGATIPDATIAAAPGTTSVPTSTVIGGLTNGVSYQFEVMAGNAQGDSVWSTVSSAVTPHALTVPAAPTGAAATASNSSATVTWLAPVSNGGSPILSYTVTALLNGQTASATATAASSATAVVVAGLSSGSNYTFTVHATNAVGSSAESIASNVVTPTSAAPDMAVSMTGPASVNAGTAATYIITASNLGPGTATGVTVSSSLPATGAFLVTNGFSASLGTCTQVSTNITCALGNMASGSTATLTVTLNVTSRIVIGASVSSTVADPNPLNNTVSMATSIASPPPTAATTDIQVTGSANNGGPTVGSTDTYTWQIRNAQNQTATNVVFSNPLPPGLLYVSAFSSVGTCTAPAPGSSGTISCSAPSLGNGQTMTVNIAVTVAQAGTITTTGSATFSGTDTNPANNSFSVSIQGK